MMNITHSSTGMMMSESCVPATRPMDRALSPDTSAATVMGMPIAPNATGAVFAIRHSPAAYTG